MWEASPPQGLSIPAIKPEMLQDVLAHKINKIFSKAIMSSEIIASHLTYSFSSAPPTAHVKLYCAKARQVIAILGIGLASLWASTSVAQIALAPQVIRDFAPSSLVTFGSPPFDLSASGGRSRNPVVFATTSAPTICRVTGATVTVVGIGNCNLTANQAGTAEYASAPQVTASIVIVPAVPTLIFQTLPASTRVETEIFMSATSSSGGIARFTSVNPTICSVRFEPAISSLYCVAYPGTCKPKNILVANSIGICVVSATQAASGNYAAASPVFQSVTITKGVQAISNFPVPLKMLGGTVVVLSATGGRSNRTIIFSTTSAPSVCTVLGSTLTAIDTGICRITANQAGDANYDAAEPVSATITIDAKRDVADAPTLVTPRLAEATENKWYSQSLLIGGTPPPTNITISGLPAGIVATHNSKGSVALVGTPTIPGTYDLVVTANNAAGTAKLAAALTVKVDVNKAQFAARANQISAGLSHSCAVIKGGVQCWGRNENGSLGNGSSGSSAAPILAIAPESGVTAVAAGRAHTCAVISGGIQCWGRNDMGQLGARTPPSPLLPSLVSNMPIQTISAGSGVTAVATGGNHTCAVVAGGVQCWGNNNYGQLGDSSYTNRLTPVQTIASGSGVTTITAGESHTCAVIDGGVYCWGYNQRGQLGDGTSINRSAPSQTIASRSGVTAIGAGISHTCALLNGGVRCWGSNSLGQLGDGGNGDSLYAVETVAVASGSTAISAGGNQTCAIVNSGVMCWGENSFGQLGDGTVTSRSTPIQTFPQNSNVTAVAVGGAHACAVVNSGMQCWGFNVYGQLGEITVTARLTPVQSIAAGSGVLGLAVSDYRTCVLVSGGVRCWGFFGDSQDNVFVSSFRSNSNQVIPAGGNVTGVALTYTHNCVVVEGGVQCWGSNSFGQVGDGSTNYRMNPVQVIGAGSGVTTVAVATGGGGHSCAVVDGGVRCWGFNDTGQLGDGSRINRLVPTQIIAAGSGVTAIGTGPRHTCAVVNGGVQCWGYNDVGQLGDGSTTNRLAPIQIVAERNGAIAVSATYEYTCAVVSAGVKCWGSNYTGSVSGPKVPVDVIGANSGVTGVAVGPSQTCAVVSGGVQCWGYNSTGALGDGSTTKRVNPVRVIDAGSGVSALAVGDSHTCAVINGGMVCFGDRLQEVRGDNMTFEAIPNFVFLVFARRG